MRRYRLLVVAMLIILGSMSAGVSSLRADDCARCSVCVVEYQFIDCCKVFGNDRNSNECWIDGWGWCHESGPDCWWV
jgi:hypothetical protein